MSVSHMFSINILPQTPQIRGVYMAFMITVVTGFVQLVLQYHLGLLRPLESEQSYDVPSVSGVIKQDVDIIWCYKITTKHDKVRTECILLVMCCNIIRKCEIRSMRYMLAY